MVSIEQITGNRKTRPDSLSSKENTVTHVIKPGNLVWGGMIDCRFQLGTQGILPAVAHGAKIGKRPDAVCFSMISTLFSDPTIAYNSARHEGPKIYSNTGLVARLSIIVTPTSLLKHFPNKTQAIGRFFHDTQYRPKFLLTEEALTVYEIPIVKSSDRIDPYDDEVVVRYENTDAEIRGITPDMWEAMVVSADHLSQMVEWRDENIGDMNIPILILREKQLQLYGDNA